MEIDVVIEQLERIARRDIAVERRDAIRAIMVATIREELARVCDGGYENILREALEASLDRADVVDGLRRRLLEHR